MKTIERTAQWVSQTYYDVQALPIPLIDGEPVLLREHILNSLVMRYRRCFGSGQRMAIPKEDLKKSLDDFLLVHEDVMARADRVVAHAIDACSSSALHIFEGSVVYNVVRPSTNKFEFDNLSFLASRWISFLSAKKALLEGDVEISSGENGGLTVYAAPLGAGADLQAMRTGRPQEKLKRKLENTGRGKSKQA